MISFSFINPFKDADGDELTYTATYDIDSANSYAALTGKWLTFDTQTLLLKGTPPVSELGKIWTIKIKASDGYKSAEITFNINLGN